MPDLPGDGIGRFAIIPLTNATHPAGSANNSPPALGTGPVRTLPRWVGYPLLAQLLGVILYFYVWWILAPAIILIVTYLLLVRRNVQSMQTFARAHRLDYQGPISASGDGVIFRSKESIVSPHDRDGIAVD